MHRQVCAFVGRKSRGQVFSPRGPIINNDSDLEMDTRLIKSLSCKMEDKSKEEGKDPAWIQSNVID